MGNNYANRARRHSRVAKPAVGGCGFGTAAVSFTSLSRRYEAGLGISRANIAYRVIFRRGDEIYGRATAACSHPSPSSAVVIRHVSTDTALFRGHRGGVVHHQWDQAKDLHVSRGRSLTCPAGHAKVAQRVAHSHDMVTHQRDAALVHAWIWMQAAVSGSATAERV